MDFKTINRKDWSCVTTLNRIGYTYDRVSENENYIVWSQRDFHPGQLNLEVWKKRWVDNPDGSRALIAPNDNEWGTYGWTVIGKTEPIKTKVLERFGIAL